MQPNCNVCVLFIWKDAVFYQTSQYNFCIVCNHTSIVDWHLCTPHCTVHALLPGAGVIAGATIGVSLALVLILVVALIVAAVFLVHRRKTLPGMCVHTYMCGKCVNCPIHTLSSCCADAKASTPTAPSTRQALHWSVKCCFHVL